MLTSWERQAPQHEHDCKRCSSEEVTCASARAASSSGVASGRWLMLSLMLLRACTQVRPRLQPPDAPAGHKTLGGSGPQRDANITRRGQLHAWETESFWHCAACADRCHCSIHRVGCGDPGLHSHDVAASAAHPDWTCSICAASRWKLQMHLLRAAWLALLKVKESSVASCQRSTVQRPYTSS